MFVQQYVVFAYLVVAREIFADVDVVHLRRRQRSGRRGDAAAVGAAQGARRVLRLRLLTVRVADQRSKERQQLKLK